MQCQAEFPLIFLHWRRFSGTAVSVVETGYLSLSFISTLLWIWILTAREGHRISQNKQLKRNTSAWKVLWCSSNRPCQLLSPSGDLGIGLVWHNLSPLDHPTDFLVPLLKSSSNWTKFSMRGPQLFSGWYQMILGVLRCSQLFLSPSGDLGTSLVWHNLSPLPLFGPTVEILFKVN